MNKLSYIASGLLLASALSSQDIQIQDGWQLLGATQELNTTQFDDAGCVDYLWKYNNQATSDADKWQLHISNSTITTNTAYPAISSLNAADGYWVKATADCLVTTNTTVASINLESLISGQTLYVMTQSPTLDSENNIIDNTVGNAEYMFNTDLTLESDGALAGIIGAWKITDNQLYYTFAPSVLDTMTNYHEYVSGSISDGCVKLNHIFPEPNSNVYPGVYFTDKTNAETYAAYLNDLNKTATDCPIDMSIFDTNISVASTVTHNKITYGTVVSPVTKRVWLDRNLGASQICISFDDEACYGDYYQWGRETDGHQVFDSPESAVSVTSNIYNTDGGFIKSKSFDEYDWAYNSTVESRAENWSKIDGSSICPIDYRVPTLEEIKNEFKDSDSIGYSVDETFNSFLKLPAAGYRQYFRLDIREKETGLWTSSYNGTDSTAVLFKQTYGLAYETFRSYGYPVRCIHDSATSQSADDNTDSSNSNTTEDDSNNSPNATNFPQVWTGTTSVLVPDAASSCSWDIVFTLNENNSASAAATLTGFTGEGATECDSFSSNAGSVSSLTDTSVLFNIDSTSSDYIFGGNIFSLTINGDTATETMNFTIDGFNGTRTTTVTK